MTARGWLLLLLGGSVTAWLGWNYTFWGLSGLAVAVTASAGLLISLIAAFRRRARNDSIKSVATPAADPRAVEPGTAATAARPLPPTSPARAGPPIAPHPVEPPRPVEPSLKPPETPPTQPESSRTPPEPATVAFARPVFEARVPRDYDQRVRLPLRNNSGRAITVAARAATTFEELPADIVGPGSVDEPVELAPGAALTLELAITAPDATRDSYEIPIEAGGASTVVRVTVDRPELKLSFRITERNPITLAATFDITNDGETIGDLALALTGEEDNIARLEPTASHAYLPGGKTLTLTATPVLYLEFERAVANVECRAAGQLRSFPIEFTAPAGRRLMGIRTGCGHHSHSFDWICTNRPNIVLTLFGPDCPGEFYDDVLEMIRDAISAAGLDPFIDAYRVVSPAIHTVLDFGGLAEGPIGTAADAANTILYAAEGDWTNAGISATAMIPLIGQGATLSKYGIKLTREAAERLGREGLERAFRSAKAATRAGDVHHVIPPYRPKSAASGAPGAGVSRESGFGPRRPPVDEAAARANAQYTNLDEVVAAAERAAKDAVAHSSNVARSGSFRARHQATTAANEAVAAAERARKAAAEAVEAGDALPGAGDAIARADAAAARAKAAAAAAESAVGDLFPDVAAGRVLDQIRSELAAGRPETARQIIRDMHSLETKGRDLARRMRRTANHQLEGLEADQVRILQQALELLNDPFLLL